MEIINAVVRQMSKPHEVLSLEIRIEKDIAKLTAIWPMIESMSFTLRVDRKSYQADIAVSKGKRPYVWISPKLKDSTGTSIRLADVLPKAGFKNKDKVRLEVSGTVATLTTIAVEPIRKNGELEQIRAAKEAEGAFSSSDPEDARRRVLATIAIRQGQGSFRERLLVAYQSTCAVTGCDAVQALEAAHIVPYFGPQANPVMNGLLLRADIHTLFDLGLIAVSPSDYRVLISSTLMDGCYASLADQIIRLPADPKERPSKQALETRLKEFQSNEGDGGLAP
jgi:hypothetical protein